MELLNNGTQVPIRASERMRDRIDCCFSKLYRFQGSVGTEPDMFVTWGFSSAGRAPALQAGGQRFDPANLHQRSEADMGQ